VSPVERLDGPFLRRPKHLAGALGERRAIAQTSSRAHGILPHPPAAFERGEMVATRGRPDVETTWAGGVIQGRVERRRPRAPAPIDAQPPPAVPVLLQTAITGGSSWRNAWAAQGGTL